MLLKATVAEVPPVFQAFVRFAMATAAIGAWCLWRGRVALALQPRREAGGACWPGAVCRAVRVHLCGFAIHLGLAADGVFVQLALLGGIAAAALYSRRAALHLAMAGPGGGVCGRGAGAGRRAGRPRRCAHPLAWLGDALGLAAGLMWALTTVVIRSTAPGPGGAGAPVALPGGSEHRLLPLLSLALGEPWSWDFSAFAWASLLVQALVGAFASYLAWMWMLARYPATKMSSFVFLTPVFALLFGAGWLGEPITADLVAALGLVAVGIVLVNRKPTAA